MESGLRAPGPPESGGLIVMVRTDPAASARALAGDLHAQLAIGGTATEAALDRLATPSPPPDLDALATAMRRAEAISERTRTEAASRLATTFNQQLAIHPDTVRRAAAELRTAHEAARQADAAAARRHQADRLLVEMGIAFVLGGAVVLAVLAGPLVGLATIGGGALVGGALFAAVTARRRRHPRPDHTAFHQQAVALAARRWAQVAGSGTDPADIESVIHRYQPQHRLVTDLLGEVPAVRAADHLAVQRRAAWVAAWRAAVGDEAPLSDPRLAQLLQRDETELWLRSDSHPSAGPNTLVVASPYADLSEVQARELHRRLLELPRGLRVIVVLEPDPDEPTGARLPGIGWVEALAGS